MTNIQVAIIIAITIWGMALVAMAGYNESKKYDGPLKFVRYTALMIVAALAIAQEITTH